MSKESSPYNFKFSGGKTNVYVFSTAEGAAYSVRFKPTPYLFGNFPELGEQVFELVVELIRSTTDKLRPDPAIAATVAAICQDFFSHQERILLYICETADFRHLARVRKFDAWFRTFGQYGFLKIDTNFPDTNGVTYYLSLIFRMGHPHRHTIIDEFERMARQYNKDE